MTNQRQQEEKQKLSRRKFMAVTAGTVAAGSVLGFGGLNFASAATPVKILVNGRTIDASSASIVKGSTMVPLRTVSEALGANVDWENSTKTVKIKTGTQSGSPPALPWPYVKLDPSEVAKRGYDKYWTEGG